MDIATYDHLEQAARATLTSWTHAAVFAPVTFEATGFPTRIGHVGQIRGLLSGMHGANRIQGYLEELAGLRPDDLVRLKAAVAAYTRWYRTVFPARAGTVPLADILAQYIAWSKVAAFPRHARVLEIGAGYGLTSLFAAADPAVGVYDAVEIAQPLYIVQAMLDAAVFGDRFRNAALDDDAEPPFRDFPVARDDGIRFRYRYDRDFRCTLFPWWKLAVPLNRTYDVIVANANLAEMAAPALSWYLPKWRDALADDGHLLVQDLGKITTRSPEDVLGRIGAAGFRALAQGQGRVGKAVLPHWNLILVTARHPDFARALPLSTARGFLTDHPTVRAVLGLDRPAGIMVRTEDLAGILAGDGATAC